MKLKFPVICLIFVSGGFSAQAQDVEAGEKIFKRCATCHKVGEGARNGPGPILNNVIGRQAGTADGFKGYGKDLKVLGESGLIWDKALIIEWITDPKKFLKARSDNPRPKSKMKFKLKDADDRANVVAYIAQFSRVAEPEEDSAKMSGDSAQIAAASGEVCVHNTSDLAHFFAVETGDGQRVTGELAAGAHLCVPGGDTGRSIVSVFETGEHLEGCSRIVSAEAAAMGHVEELRQYAEFDRCLWSSNAP